MNLLVRNVIEREIEKEKVQMKPPMHGFKSAILAKLKKDIFCNMPQVPPNPGFMHEKVLKGDFQKKDR